MDKREESEVRKQALARYEAGEQVTSICRSFARSRAWLYIWLKRYLAGKEGWYCDKTRGPHGNPRWTPEPVEEAVKYVRLELYNQGVFCGAQAIRWRMEELEIKPIPSLRTVGRILSRNDLTYRRTGRYEPKGILYPKAKAEKPNDLHQTDFVGPCYLTGGLRFYSLNSVDLATGRCAVEPVVEGKDRSIAAFWAIWNRLGIPRFQQVDNEMTFYGSPAYPRGMGKLIRLCLLHGVEPVFIPLREPWRNGVVEKFNDHWRQKFLARIEIHTARELFESSLKFESLHNSRYRYSKLGGGTPLEALSAMKVALRFPSQREPPEGTLPKPKQGKYHVIRFIRSDRKFDLFGEIFQVSPVSIHEYIWATINVKQQSLSMYIGDELIDERKYQLR